MKEEDISGTEMKETFTVGSRHAEITSDDVYTKECLCDSDL
jgi:hypothetical protein